jgi:hypothetical protein
MLKSACGGHALAVFARRLREPLVADQGGEAARLPLAIDEADNLLLGIRRKRLRHGCNAEQEHRQEKKQRANG